MLLKHVPAGFLEKVVKKSGLASYQEESTRDAPLMLNFEDTEEEPLVGKQSPFDRDIESLDLY